jgi:antitoxin ParD1/3/4
MTLESHWIEYLDKLVAAGRYPSREEALGRALTDLLMREAKFTDLKAAIQEGIDSGPAEPFSFADVATEARREWEARDIERRPAAE